MNNYLSPHDLEVVKRVLNDIRKQFPVKEAFDFEERLLKIFHQHLWDVLANLQTQYENEAEYSGNKMAEEYNPDNPDHERP